MNHFTEISLPRIDNCRNLFEKSDELSKKLKTKLKVKEKNSAKVVYAVQIMTAVCFVPSRAQAPDAPFSNMT